MKKDRIRNGILDLLAYAAGCAIYAVAVAMFITPNRISPGGVTGVATTMQFLWGAPVGLVVFLLNVPILILGFVKFGGRFIAKTAVATIILSISLDIAEWLVPPYETDGILAALFGGLLMGTGMSMVLLRGATTGGVDILAKYLNSKFRHLSVGRFILMMDGAVIAFAVLAYRNLESALYSVVTIYVSSMVIDQLLYGSDSGKLIFVITKEADTLSDAIFSQLGRGVTRMQVVGGYTRTERTMLLCAVRRHEAAKIHAIVRKLDPQAFLIVSDVGEIIGEGFKVNAENES